MADMDLQVKITTNKSAVNATVNDLNKVGKEVKKIGDEAGKSNIFSGLKDQAEDFAGNLTSSLGSVGNLITSSLTTPIGAAGFALGALAAEAKFLFDQSLAGEKINAINTQFDNLAKSVNISANALRDRLLVSIDGLVDGVGSIQLANRAMITLGEKAAALPRLMDLAKKSVAGFGGEPLQNLEVLIRAIETGNTKMLSQIGIIINAEKAMKTYADSQKQSVENLTEQGKQQAILNAVLAQGESAFKNVSGTLTPLSDSFTRVKNTLGDIKEAFQVFIANNYSKIFVDIFESINSGLKKISGNFGATDRIKELAEEIEKAQNTINQLTLDQQSLQGEKGINFQANLSLINTDLAKQKALLIPLTAEYNKLNKELDEASKKSVASTVPGTKSGAGDFSTPEYKPDQDRLDQLNVITKNAVQGIKEEVAATELELKNLEKAALATASVINNSFASGLTNGLLDFADGTKTAEQAFNDFARGFLRQITQMILQQTILNAIGGSGGGIGKLFGGAVPAGKADGGYISGPGSGTSDSIPVRLSNGEYVIRAKAVKKVGIGFLNGINQIDRTGARTKSKGGLHRYAEGGMVTGPSGPPQVVIQNNGTPKQNTGQTFDPASGVTKIILEDYQKNGPISKAMQGSFGVKRGGFK